MARNIFKGLGIALVTPFTADGQVDYKSLKRLLEYQIDNGADFLCILATTGETPCLTQQEKDNITQLVKDVNHGRLPILKGCGGNNTAAEAVQLFDDFLAQLAKRSLKVFVISGNHDSPERIAFGSRIMDASGIHMSPVYSGDIAPIPLEDEFGTVNIYILPFIKPAHVRRYAENEITTYTEAVEYVISKLNIDPANHCP